MPCARAIARSGSNLPAGTGEVVSTAIVGAARACCMPSVSKASYNRHSTRIHRSVVLFCGDMPVRIASGQNDSFTLAAKVRPGCV